MIEDIKDRSLALDRFDEGYGQRSTFIERIRLFLLKRRVNALLHKTLWPHPVSRSEDLPEHLRRDIGLY